MRQFLSSGLSSGIDRKPTEEHSRQRKQEKQSLSGKELASSEKATCGLEQCSSTVHQALAGNDNPKTLPMIQRESDSELRPPASNLI